MCIFCNNYGKNLAYLKPPDFVQRPRVSSYGLKTLLCSFWNSSSVLHDRVSDMSLVATPYANYHELTKVARNYCSRYDKISENCGPLRLEENDRKHTANLSTFKCYTCRHSSYRSNTATSDLHSFRSLQSFLTENYLMTLRR